MRSRLGRCWGGRGPLVEISTLGLCAVQPAAAGRRGPAAHAAPSASPACRSLRVRSPACLAPPIPFPRWPHRASAQEAAGTYAFLRDVACLKLEQPRPLDLTPEAAAMLEKLMLAQAQVPASRAALLYGK